MNMHSAVAIKNPSSFHVDIAPWLRLLPVAGYQDTGEQLSLARVTLDINHHVTALTPVGRQLVGVPGERIEFRRPQAATSSLSIDQIATAELRSRADGGVELNLLPATGGQSRQPLAIDGATGNLWLAPQTGNVGIGTVSTPQQLSITGGIGFANQNAMDKKLYSPADGVLEWMTHDAAGQHGLAVSHQGQQRVFFNTNGTSYFNGGNVGIGTTTPGEKLEISGNVMVRSPDSFIYNVGFARTDESGREHKWALWHMNKDYRKNALEIWEYKTDSKGKNCGGNPADGAMCEPRLVILEGGNVGIGTVSPGARFQVQGDAKILGTVSCRALSQWSSMREKENVKYIDNILDRLEKLNPAFFDRKSEYHNGAKNNLGFIAEEVREVFPELVNPDEENDFFAASVRTDGMLALAIAGIKELSQRLRALQTAVSIDRHERTVGPSEKTLRYPQAPVEILREKTCHSANGTEERYVIVQFYDVADGGDNIGSIRGYQIPNGMAKEAFLQEQYKDWLKLVQSKKTEFWRHGRAR